MHVFDSCNPRPVLPEFFFVIGCHKPGKLVAVLVVSGKDVSLHFLWSSCRCFMRGVPVLASDSGYYPRSGMLPLARSSRHSNLRPQFAEILPAILWLQRVVFHCSIEALSNYLKGLKEELLSVASRKRGYTKNQISTELGVSNR